MTRQLKPDWLQILLALGKSDLNGQEIMRAVRDATRGQCELWPGKLYGALKELRDQGLVVEVDRGERTVRGGTPRYYSLTTDGRKTMAVELSRLESVLELAAARRLYRSSRFGAPSE